MADLSPETYFYSSHVDSLHLRKVHSREAFRFAADYTPAVLPRARKFEAMACPPAQPVSQCDRRACSRASALASRPMAYSKISPMNELGIRNLSDGLLVTSGEQVISSPRSLLGSFHVLSRAQELSRTAVSDSPGQPEMRYGR